MSRQKCAFLVGILFVILIGPVVTQTSPKNASCDLVDIVFVLDSSGSIGPANWLLMLDFAKEIVSVFDVGPQNVQFGANYYGSYPTLAFHLNRYNNRVDVMAAIGKIPYNGGGTNTAGGIYMMHNDMFTEENGARTNVPSLGIVITDGHSNNYLNTIAEANATRQKDIMLMALGIGGNINQIELTGIANSPPELFVFNVLDFKNLSSILEEMVSSACDVIPAKPTFIQCAKTRFVEGGTKRYGLDCMFRSFPAYDTVLWRVGDVSIPINTKVNSFRSTVKAEKDNMFMATLVIDEVTDEMYTKEFKLIVTNKFGESNITIALQKGNYSCFGNITKLTPTGASATTASQDSLSVTGVPASNKLVDADLSELTNMKHCYEQAGQNNCIHPAVVAGLASRESRAGRLLNSTDGYGDNGKAYGILQCDIATSGLGDNCTMFAWDSCEHIDMMVKRVFLVKVKQVQNKLPKWLPERQLQGGVAAYNFGVSNVKTWKKLDVGTTGNDYSNDVIARAQRLVNEHGWTYGTGTDVPGTGVPGTDVPDNGAAGPHAWFCIDSLLFIGSFILL